MAELRGGLAGKSGKRSTLEVSSDGTNYFEIPGISAIRIDKPEAASTTYRALEGVLTELSEADIGNISIDIISYLPGTESWDIVDTAATANTSLNWRITTSGETLLPATTGADKAAIDTAGAVTFAGEKPDFTNNKFLVGHAIKIGSDYHVISSIDITGAVTTVKTKKPASAVVSALYSIVMPKYRWSWVGRVATAGGVSITENAPMASTLTITPNTQLAKPSIVG